MKKITVSEELTYFIAIILLSLAVAILTRVNFGVSMIVAPAYILSVKLGVITFGEAEYIVQGILFIILCIAIKSFKPIYLMSFITCLIYGKALDLWRMLPCFNENVSINLGIPVRIILFITGMLLTSFSIALFFKTYLYPQVYDFFTKAVSKKYNLKLSVFKTIFDMTFLAIGTIMTLVFFKKLVGINFGTIIMTFLNGTLIGFFSKTIDRFFEFKPTFKKFAGYFEM